jgi:Peptidase family S41
MITVIRSKNWLRVSFVILAVALQVERSAHAQGSALVIASALPGVSRFALGQAADAPDEKFDPEKLRADFRIAREALEEGHSGIYRYTSKKELDAIFDQADKSLTRPMSMLEFYRVLAPAVAAIKCGHTSVSLPKGFSKSLTGKNGVLPLEVRVLEGKIYVWRDFSGSPASFAGMEIRSINGVEASKIVNTMLAAASGDGDVETSRMRRIGGWRFSVQLPALAGLSAPYDLVLRGPKRVRDVEIRLAGADFSHIEEVARARFPQDQPPSTSGEFKFLDEGKIAVMKIHGFGGFVDAERKKDLKEFYHESFDAMNKKGTNALVLDLRDNGGGEDELGMLLLSYLLAKPFRYYDGLALNAREFKFQKYTEPLEIPADAVVRQPDGTYRLAKHPNLGTQQPGKPTFAGKVFILLNGGSFSTTSEFLSQSHFHKRATFIGEESGGGYYGNSSGAVPEVTLPNTKLIVRVPLVTYYMAVSGYKAAAHGVIPDYPIRYTIEELLAGTDKELARALELARR